MNGYSHEQAELKREMEIFLDGLGNSSEEVAATLKDLGVKARFSARHSTPFRTLDCPIAVALQQRFESGRAGFQVFAEFSRRRDPDFPVKVDHGEPVYRFVTDFDAGKYPFLYQDEAGS